MTMPKSKERVVKSKISTHQLTHIVIRPKVEGKNVSKDIGSFMDVMASTIQKTWPSLQVVAVGNVNVVIPQTNRLGRKGKK